MSHLTTITTAEIMRLHKAGNVVFAYPRKGIVVVDGYRRFRASPLACKAAKNLAITKSTTV